MDAMDKNLINMDNEHDPIYGKLHTVSNTSQLPGGPALQVVRLTIQGRLTPYVAPTTTREQYNYITKHHKNQFVWLEDMNAEEACKKLIILVINAVYLEPLWEPRFEYKGKTLRNFLDLLIDEFQATPEEQAAVKALIKQAWDPKKHIVKLLSRLKKKQLTILGKMRNIILYPKEDFIEALYMTAQEKKQFPKACTK